MVQAGFEQELPLFTIAMMVGDAGLEPATSAM